MPVAIIFVTEDNERCVGTIDSEAGDGEGLEPPGDEGDGESGGLCGDGGILMGGARVAGRATAGGDERTGGRGAIRE